MTENDSAAEKRIVGELNFGAKTSKRVTWEAWEFTVEGPHEVEVTNASYGFEKDDHSYIVGIEERDGQAIPAECGCKADRYREDYDCKHKVALVSIGGSVVLQAAMDYSTPTVDTERTDTSTLADSLRADGGVVVEDADTDSPALDAVDREKCACADLPNDFPCWPCVRNGKRPLP